jgi:TolA-binding protein
MNNKIKHIDLFNRSGCISQDGMIKYLNDTLTSEERHVVEMHLLDCELCSDATEGLSSLGEEKRTIIINKDLSLSHFTKRKVIPKWITYTSVAAAIAIIITTSILTNTYNSSLEKETAENKKVFIPENIGKKDVAEKSNDNSNIQELAVFTKTTVDQPGKSGYFRSDYTAFEQKPETGKELDEKTDLLDSVIAGDGLTSIVTANGESTLIIGGAADKSGGEVKEAEKQSGSVTSDEEYETTKTTKTENYKKGKNKESKRAAVAQNVVDGDLSIEGKKMEEKNSLYEEAINLYNTSRFMEAIIKFESFIQSNPENCDARYFCALSYYKTYNTRSALKQLDKLTKSNDNECYEKARFQKALILKNTNKKADADKIFKNIIKENSPFRDDAKKEMNK